MPHRVAGIREKGHSKHSARGPSGPKKQHWVVRGLHLRCLEGESFFGVRRFTMFRRILMIGTLLAGITVGLLGTAGTADAQRGRGWGWGGGGRGWGGTGVGAYFGNPGYYSGYSGYGGYNSGYGGYSSYYY